MELSQPKISVDEVDQRAKEDPKAFFARCDAQYEARLAEAADRIAARAAGHRQFVLLAGPSASGKTTTSLKLKAALRTRGIHSTAVSLDDFFRDRRTLPVLADGREDWESPAALDLALFTEVTTRLLKEGRAEYPVFDFKKARRGEKTRRLEFPQGSVAVVEGLHAFNPAVAACLPEERIFRLYVSVGSAFTDEKENILLSARDVRLVRRMLRDYRFRASSASNTLALWESVCRGEDEYVRPYKDLADLALDTVFACEPCLFAGMVLWHFESERGEEPLSGEAERLVAALKRFERIPQDLVPPACLLREFLGGSSYLNKRALKRRRTRAAKPEEPA